MTLKQLRFLREVARQSLNISSAAAALHTSQPGVSRQIQQLEQELGVRLLVRRKNRVLGITTIGRSILEAANRVLEETENIRLMARDATGEQGGRLRIATTHLHARHSLRAPLAAFARRHPKVELQLLQVDADDIGALVEGDGAEIGISTETAGERPALVLLEGEVMRRSLIMPARHPLTAKRRPRLADLGRYPLVGYNPRSRSGHVIADTFRAHGIAVHYVVSASDSDVIKVYVKEGLGIAVVPTLALEDESQRGLHVVDVTHLFPESRLTISLRRDTYPRTYLTDFVHALVPAWDRAAVLKATGMARA
jgi:LysR family cys regulon transcriptional activator